MTTSYLGGGAQIFSAMPTIWQHYYSHYLFLSGSFIVFFLPLLLPLTIIFILSSHTSLCAKVLLFSLYTASSTGTLRDLTKTYTQTVYKFVSLAKLFLGLQTY